MKVGFLLQTSGQWKTRGALPLRCRSMDKIKRYIWSESGIHSPKAWKLSHEAGFSLVVQFHTIAAVLQLPTERNPLMVKRKNRLNGDSRAFHAPLSLLCSTSGWGLQKLGYGRHTRSWFRVTNGCDSITRVIQKKLGWTMYYPSSDTRTEVMTSGTANNLKRVTFSCCSSNFLRVWMSVDAFIVIL